LQRALAEQYLRALSLVREHRGKIDALSDALLSKGVVHKAELEDILGDKVKAREVEVPACGRGYYSVEYIGLNQVRYIVGGSNIF
ncbi:unnamed protein product, partial [Laminaria digitata]